MRYRRATSITKQVQWVLYTLQTPPRSLQIQNLYILWWQKRFHGIPWNYSCHRNWRTPSSIDFHEILLSCSSQRNWRTPSSMEFHGFPWNCSCQRNWRTPSSMKFHGIAWNCSSQRNWSTPSSMEYDGIPWNLKCANFVDGIARASEIGAP